MLCADVSPADGASIQQNLKLLEEKLQTVGLFSERTHLSLAVLRDANPPPPVLAPRRSRPVLAPSEGDAGAGADVRPSVVVSGGGGEPAWRAAGQRSARSGCDGGDGAPQAEVAVHPSSLWKSA